MTLIFKMGILDLFKKTEQKVETEKSKTGVADEIIEYALNLVEDKASIKEQLKEIDKIGKLPIEKKESAYIPIYLNLEKVILGKKLVATKEYFSRQTLKVPKTISREELRKTIKEKFEINKLGNELKVLFLDEPQRNLILYELMYKKFIDLIPSNISKKISTAISKEKSKLDKIITRKISRQEVISNFRNFFSFLYENVAKNKDKQFVNELVANTYNFVSAYGYPLNADALQILPKIYTKSATLAVARSIIDYVSNTILRKDLIRAQIDNITNAEILPEEEKERIYFSVYFELEKFVIEHKPPAVKKAYTKEELRREIKENNNIQNLEHKFKLLFLEEEEQVIEMFTVFYELFLKEIMSFWKLSDIQKFVNENVKGKMFDGFIVEKEGINFNVLEKNKQSNVAHDLSKFFRVLYKKTKEVAGDKKAELAINNSYKSIKEQYSQLPTFNDFVRAIPEGVLEHEKRILLSPKVAEDVVLYVAQILKKSDIEEHVKSLHDARKLPLEEQSEAFFNIYLNLQHYIIEERPSFKGKEITLAELKERIRNNFNIKDLEDKFQLLFLREDEVLIKLVKDLVKECIVNFIDKKALVEAEKELIKRERTLRNVEIDEEGSINFESFISYIKNIKADKIKALNFTLSKVVLAVFEKTKGILGELQAKKLFDTAYVNLQTEYGANLLQVLKVIPKGILEAEKFEMLGKEEMEKTAKEMVKIDLLKGEFMNIAAHELKTPLVPIISYLEMLLNDKRLARDQKEKIRICLSSAKREADLVSDILDISKLESGTLKLEPETVDIVELLREAADGLSPAVKEKKLAFKIDIPSKLPLINADRRRLMQVVTNLINNATKFTEKGSIIVKAQKKEQNILVSVADTGVGVSQENQRKLFTKFFQADTTARRKYGGTGLGLAICKGIIEGHKGEIWIESKLGQGSTFYFTVPILNQKY